MQFTSEKESKPLFASFYKDLHFSDKSLVITAMQESSFGKEIRIAFQEGQVMKEHKTKFPITVMTLRGCVEFTVKEEVYLLKAGDVIALEGSVMHSLRASEESIVRLSLHKSDSVDRVKSLLE